MAYGDFAMRVGERGAVAVKRLPEEKMTYFVYQGKPWRCTDRDRILMTAERADGYEMRYCLNLYCDEVPR